MDERAASRVARILLLATWIGAPQATAQPILEASVAPGTQAEKQELRTHHVGFQLGFFNPTAELVELGNLGFVLDRSDGMTVLRYRYSLNPRVDLVAELKYWTRRGPTSSSGEGKVSGGFMGPGVRVNATKWKRVVPYLQGNVYYAQEMLGEPKVIYAHGIGFGISGGANFEVTPLFSVPIEATYVGSGGGGLDDLSGFGLTVGVNFNF